MNRREFSGLTVAAMAASVLAADSAPAQELPKAGGQFAPIHDRRRPEIAILLYPGLTLMDVLGPQTVFSISANVHLVWKSKDLIVSDTGIGVRPTATLDECPANLDVLLVGGGPGQMGVMQDPTVLEFLADRGSRAKYVTSVCSGSLILGAAGLLDGYKATCHWTGRGLLPLFGAIPVEERVVVDRNRVTGGGVTAGLDFGLVLLAKLLGEDVAKMTQLAMEYDPQPPFDAGTPKKAGKELTKQVLDWLAPMNDRMRQVLEESKKQTRR